MDAVNISEYLDTFGTALASKLDEASVPLVKHGERSIRAELTRRPFPSQWDRIEATCATLKRSQAAIISGETGTGKTLMSQVAVHGHANGKPYRCLVLCPSHLVKKWIREVRATIPGAVAKSINHYSDLMHLRTLGEPTRAEFYIISDSKAKLGTGWNAVANKKRNTGTYHCVTCNGLIEKSTKDDDGDAVKVPATMKDLEKKQQFCEHCGDALWTWNRKFDRWPCADLVKKKLKGFFDYFVLDEAHVSKSSTSAIGASVGALAATVQKSGGKVIAMTGTLINGYADSLFPTLYRLMPAEMRSLGFSWSDNMKFLQRYGRLETITTYEGQKQYRSNKMSKGKQTSKTVRPKPGILPTLYGDCMLPNTVFIGLEDLGFDLPPQQEILHRIEMSPIMAACYRDIEGDLRDALSDMLRCGSKAAMSIMLNTLLGWPDHPRGFGEIGYIDAEGEYQLVTTVPDLDDSIERAKEDKLVEIIAEQVRRRRQSWVYTVMTQKRDVQRQLVDRLVREGIDARELKSQRVPTSEREDWIHKNKDAQVIVVHPKCVATGLDSFGDGFNFCSLIWYGLSYELDIVRQASGRARRVGQRKDCEIHYLYYGDTMQEKCAHLMSEKTRAARAIDGNFSSDGLAGLSGGDDNAQMMLVKALMR